MALCNKLQQRKRTRGRAKMRQQPIIVHTATHFKKEGKKGLTKMELGLNNIAYYNTFL